MGDEVNAKLRDLPRFHEITNARNAMRLMTAMRRLVRPAYWLMRHDMKQYDEKTAEWQELERQAQDLTSVPDRFNAIFGPRGWIMYEMMNFEVAKACVAKADEGDFDGAELDLVAHYEPEQIRFQLMTMNAIKAFRVRTPLAEKALADYAAGRYYASVLVTLSLLDGLVNDLHERQVGFFSRDLELSAWDSLSAHDSGLKRLNTLLQTKRQRTTSETITIPFRHGIIHGRDMGYDNQMVAAKSWAALFAVRDWAIKAEKNELAPPPPKPERGLKDVLRDLVETVNKTQDLRQAVDAWKPRSVQIAADIPRTGTPDDYEEGTPERRVVEFFHLLKRGNYGGLVGCVDSMHFSGLSTKAAAGDLRKRFRSVALDHFELTRVEDESAALSNVGAVVRGRKANKSFNQTLLLRLVFGSETDRFLPRGFAGGEWRLVSLPALGPELADTSAERVDPPRDLAPRQLSR